MSTEAQRRAGNYPKKHARFAGMAISIESRKGSYRSGVADGKPWRVKMPADYGYIRGTVGRDGDPVDCFLGPCDEDEAPLVWVCDQAKPNGNFDEHKVFLGFRHAGDVWTCWRQAYDVPVHGRFHVMTMEKWKSELRRRGGGMRNPLREFSKVWRNITAHYHPLVMCFGTQTGKTLSREFAAGELLRHAGEAAALRRAKPWLFKKPVISAAERAVAASPREAVEWSLALRRRLGMAKL